VKLNYKRLFVLGLGFGVISLTWSLYNSFVPVLLRDLLQNVKMQNFVIGIIMTFDNIAAITLQPYFGARSDRTWNKLGRRLPYIVVGMPIAAVFFILVPFARGGLALLIPTLVAMNICMAAFRAPTVALMPDITPSPLRSQANGVINLMGGLGSLIAFFIGGMLYDMNPILPFLLSGIVMFAITAILPRVIKEPEHLESSPKDKSVGIVQAMKEVFTEGEHSRLYMLLAILFWFIGWSAVEAHFTLFATSHFGWTEGRAAMALGAYSVAFLAFSIPSGFIAAKYGRRRTILTGLLGMTFMLFVFPFVPTIGALGLLLVGGLFWSLVNISSYPMVVDMSSGAKIGSSTGLYYFFSALAAISGPPIMGLLVDWFGGVALFLGSGVFFVLSILCMLNVRRGEVAKAEHSETGAATTQIAQG
jgi:MFS family permease